MDIWPLLGSKTNLLGIKDGWIYPSSSPMALKVQIDWASKSVRMTKKIKQNDSLPQKSPWGEKERPFGAHLLLFLGFPVVCL
jgi:hypothetical protein